MIRLPALLCLALTSCSPFIGPRERAAVTFAWSPVQLAAARAIDADERRFGPDSPEVHAAAQLLGLVVAEDDALRMQREIGR